MKKKINWSKWTRKTHYWVSAVIILPILIVIITGILLQLKKEINWIQPPTIKGQV
ncbi:MAG: PepSY domain-containing protein, partial [Candidatus Marinimicrobia bacterium]|nr:PepSY domain-containing protein [Candidatus Neomarinimicrobiota bacterium]